MTRQARDQRRRGVAVELTDRDRALLRALLRFRIARSGDLARLFFPGRHKDVSNDRFRRLYDAQILEAHVPERAAENVYSLGVRGKRWLQEQGMTVGSVPRAPWAHHLGVVRFWSKVAAATHLLSGTRLVSFRPEWELRERVQGPSHEVVPDALVEVELGGTNRERLRLAVEVDRGTEGLRVLVGKVQTYASMRGLPWDSLGRGDFTLLMFLLDAGERRERQVRELVAAEFPASFEVWTDRSPLVDELRRLCGFAPAPVTASRHGNGSDLPASREADSLSGVTGEGLSGDE